MKLANRPGLVVVLLSVIAGAFGGAPPTLAASAAAATPLVTGDFSSSGQPVHDGYVVAFAWPNQTQLDRVKVGRAGALYPVAATEVGVDGTFRLLADPKLLPARLRGPSGYVNLELMAVSHGRQLVLDVPVTPTSAGAGPSAWRATTSGSRPGATPVVSFDFGSGVAVNLLDAPSDWARSSERPQGASAARAATSSVLPESAPLRRFFDALKLHRGVSTHPRVSTANLSSRAALPLPPPGCHFIKRRLSTNHKEHFTTTQTWSGAPETVTESTSADHTLGVAYRLEGHGLAQSGTHTISRSSAHSASTTYDRPHQIFNRVNYRRYFAPCVTGDRTKWVPESFYDILSNDGLDMHRVDFYNCSPHRPDDHWDTGEATNITYAHGVSILGIELTAQSGYGSSLNMHYHFNRFGEICGNDRRGPASSSRVEADPYGPR